MQDNKKIFKEFEEFSNDLSNAATFILQHNFKEAEKILKKYKEYADMTPLWHSIKANIYVYKNQMHKAIEYYEKVLEKFKDDPCLLLNYSKVLYWKRDYKKAIEKLARGYRSADDIKYPKKIYQEFFKVLSAAPNFSSPQPNQPCLTPGFIPNYNEASNAKRLKLDKKYAYSQLDFYKHINSLMRSHKIINKDFVYLGTDMRKYDFYTYKTNYEDEYKIVFNKGIIDYSSVISKIEMELFKNDLGHFNSIYFPSVDENKKLSIEIGLSINKSKDSYKKLKQILKQKNIAPIDSELYKLNRDSVKKCYSFGDKNVLTLILKFLAFKEQLLDTEKIVPMLKHLSTNYNIRLVAEKRYHDDIYLTFLVDGYNDGKVLVDSYIFKNTDIYETNYDDIDKTPGFTYGDMLMRYK